MLPNLKFKLLLIFILNFIVFNSTSFANNENAVIHYISQIKFNLVLTLKKYNFKIEGKAIPSITINESKQVNANSEITINYGMFNYIESEDELAGIIGHELAHNYLKLKYDDDDNKPQREYDADELGSFIALKSGYNPFGLHNLLKRIANDPERKSNQEIEEQTHPEALERVNNLVRFLKNNKFTPKKDKENSIYRSYISLLYRKNKISNEEQRKIQPILLSLKEEIDDIKNSGDVQLKIKVLFSSLEKLSKIAIKYPHLNNYNLMRYSITSNEFTNDLLYKFYPDWLSSDYVFGARFNEVLLQLNELALSICPVIGDGIDLYELSIGKSFFDGNNLSYTSRLVAGAGLILGSRQIYEGSGKIIDQIIHDFPDLTSEAKSTLKTLENKLAKAEILDAQSVNKKLSEFYSEPPFKMDRPVLLRTTSEEEKFVRVVSDETRLSGNWLVRPEEIEGLSPSQIQDLLALPVLPSKIIDVTIPEGVELLEGVSHGIFDKTGGGWQIYINQNSNELPIEWFSNIRPL